MRGVEAEVAFRLGHDLPPRGTPYTREEIVAALATAHPAIEILDPPSSTPMSSSRSATSPIRSCMAASFTAPASPPGTRSISRPSP